MAVKLDLYNDIKNHIKTCLPEVKTVRLWNNQLENDSKENAYSTPAVFIEFENIGYGQRAKGVQIVNFSLAFHIVIHSYKNEETYIFDLEDKLFGILQGFRDLRRTSDQQDTNHNNVIHWVSRYDTSTQFDEAGSRNRAYNTPTTVTDIEINTDLDIDNDEIRTGDGEF